METLYTPRRTFSKLGFALFLFACAGIVFSLILSLVSQFVPTIAVLFSNVSIQLFFRYLHVYGLGFLLFWLVSKTLPKQQPTVQRLSFGTLFKAFCICYMFTYIGNITGNVVNNALHNAMNITEIITDFVGRNEFFSIFVPIIVAPFVEEMIFRKMLIDRTKQYGEKTAILCSAISFGLVHMNLTQFLYASGFGLVFGYIYCKTGKIHYTMIMHAVVNTLSVLQIHLVKPMIGIGTTESLTMLKIIPVILGLILSLTMIGFAITGLVFFILTLARKRIVLTPATNIQASFGQVVLNPGVCMYVVLCIGMIVLSLFGVVS